MTSKLAALDYAPEVHEAPRLSRDSLRAQRYALLVWLVVSDAVALGAAFGLAYYLRFTLKLTVAPEALPDIVAYRALSALLTPLWLLVFLASGLYDTHGKNGAVESARAFNASTVATMLVVVATFLIQDLVISRAWLLYVWTLSFLCIAANRFMARRIVYAVRRRGRLLAPALIVGTNPEAESLAAFLADRQASGVWTAGFVTTSLSGLPGSRVPVLGHVGEIASVVAANGIEEVIVAITAVTREELLALCEDLDRSPVQLRLSSGLCELLTTRVAVHTLGTVPVMSLQKNRLSPVERVVKGLVEYSLALFTLAVLAVPMLLVALLIKLDSKGPAMHRRRVLGVAGRQFDAFKFRTMYVNGDELLRQQPQAVEDLRINHKLKDDPRITRVGRWLRKFSFDEVPQLFNVLKGQMSLVGPRMITLEEAAKYGPQRINLFTVKPGITGLWQVSGRSDLRYDERVKIDMYYVRNYSVWLDLQILFIQTLPAVLRSRGAY